MIRRLSSTMFNILIAAFVFYSLSLGADAQARPSEGCGSINGEADCIAYPGCRWFLGTCTEKPLVNCWQSAKSAPACNKIQGCRWFAEPTEYFPPSMPRYVQPIQCRDQTVCDVFVSPKDCNSKSWCAWVDGKCQAYGTQPSDDWNPKCYELGIYQSACKFQSPKCKWFSFNVANEFIVYGCRRVEFCEFNKGKDLEYQCKQSKFCKYENGKCIRNPTQSPTLSPTQSPSVSPTTAPTKPTKSPTKAPTTKGPTIKPTTRSPTIRPTTVFPTAKPASG